MTAVVVEDEPLVFGVFRSVLQIHGFTVLAAETADGARRHCGDRQLPIDLLIVDRRVSGASGIDLALDLRRFRPDLPVVVTSGMPTEYWEITELQGLSTLAKGSYAFLEKPFTARKLMDTVDELLAQKMVLQVATLGTGSGL